MKRIAVLLTTFSVFAALAENNLESLPKFEIQFKSSRFKESFRDKSDGHFSQPFNSCHTPYCYGAGDLANDAFNGVVNLFKKPKYTVVNYNLENKQTLNKAEADCVARQAQQFESWLRQTNKFGTRNADILLSQGISTVEINAVNLEEVDFSTTESRFRIIKSNEIGWEFHVNIGKPYSVWIGERFTKPKGIRLLPVVNEASREGSCQVVIATALDSMLDVPAEEYTPDKEGTRGSDLSPIRRKALYGK